MPFHTEQSILEKYLNGSEAYINIKLIIIKKGDKIKYYFFLFWGLLLGSSRKSWIDHLCGAPHPLDRLGGSLASAVIGVQQGVEIIRAHDVRETVQALETTKVLARS